MNRFFIFDAPVQSRKQRDVGKLLAQVQPHDLLKWTWCVLRLMDVRENTVKQLKILMYYADVQDVYKRQL